jgi:hypothetical protein
MSESVDEVVDTELQRFRGIVQREAAFIKPLPYLAEIIVLVDDHHNATVVVFQT